MADRKRTQPHHRALQIRHIYRVNLTLDQIGVFERILYVDALGRPYFACYDKFICLNLVAKSHFTPLPLSFEQLDCISHQHRSSNRTYSARDLCDTQRLLRRAREFNIAHYFVTDFVYPDINYYRAVFYPVAFYDTCLAHGDYENLRSFYMSRQRAALACSDMADCRCREFI